MAKRFVTVTAPDGTVLKRQTAREYSHVIVKERKGERGVSLSGKTIAKWDAFTWIGRPDLVAARIKSEIGLAGITKTGLIKDYGHSAYYLIETDK
tara:strand:+ start:431 stop:715 length:285 start_codon:yes stop_codon:yes gene_type:complete